MNIKSVREEMSRLGLQKNGEGGCCYFRTRIVEQEAVGYAGNKRSSSAASSSYLSTCVCKTLVGIILVGGFYKPHLSPLNSTSWASFIIMHM